MLKIDNSSIMDIVWISNNLDESMPRIGYMNH